MPQPTLTVNNILTSLNDSSRSQSGHMTPLSVLQVAKPVHTYTVHVSQEPASGEHGAGITLFSPFPTVLLVTQAFP